MIGSIHKIHLFVAVVTILGAVSAPAQASSSVYYGYDPNGRLVTALYDNGICGTYVYDANGNRTSQSYAMVTPSPANWGSATWGCSDWTP